MATFVLSSAITKTLLNNERFSHSFWKQAIRKSIQQRRRSRGTYLQCYGRVSTACQRILPPSAGGEEIRDETQSITKVAGADQQILHSLTYPSRFSNVSNGHVPNGMCGLAVGWINSLHTLPISSTPRVGLDLSLLVRRFQTSTRYSESDKVPPHTPAVGAWETVKDKKEKFREVGQDFIEDIKETKAKVREQMEAIIERENIWTFPNFLCISRIVCSPFLCNLVILGEYKWALGLFMFAGFTDLLDGWIARTFPSQASRLGSFLDPLADKILVAMLFFSLTYVGLIPLPLTGLIIYRDVLIIGGASFVRYKSLPPPKTITRYFDATHATAQLAPTTISKINTAIQLSLITASLAAPVFGYTDHYLLKTLCWVTGITTLSSGISYIFSKDTYKILRQMKKQS